MWPADWSQWFNGHSRWQIALPQWPRGCMSATFWEHVIWHPLWRMKGPPRLKQIDGWVGLSSFRVDVIFKPMYTQHSWYLIFPWWSSTCLYTLFLLCLSCSLMPLYRRPLSPYTLKYIGEGDVAYCRRRWTADSWALEHSGHFQKIRTLQGT